MYYVTSGIQQVDTTLNDAWTELVKKFMQMPFFDAEVEDHARNYQLVSKKIVQATKE